MPNVSLSSHPRPARPIRLPSSLSRKGGPALNVPETPTPASPAYRNEWELGEAIRRSGAPRSTLFVTTKLRSARETDPSAALRRSLDRLGLDYVDLYLVHSPFRAESPEQLRRLWRGMEDAREAGLARSVGVSNFTREHLDIILEGARSKPAVNQSAFAPTSHLPPPRYPYVFFPFRFFVLLLATSQTLLNSNPPHAPTCS